MKYSTLCYSLLTFFYLSSAEESPVIKIIKGGISGNGITTRYWDCCKPSCAWKENINTPTMQPVISCAADGVKVLNASVQSGCDYEGEAFMCNSEQAWVVNSTLAYGFAAASFTGGADTNLCCACFLLSFTDQITNKKMLVQNTNTGSDLQQNQFDIAIPGGGLGIFQDGCPAQWGTARDVWQVNTVEDCGKLPEAVRPGCKFRFDFMEGASNPNIEFVQVQCPDELVAVSKCNL